MKNKIIKLTESDIESLVKKILKEDDEWQWVKEIKAEKIYDPKKKDDLVLQFSYALNYLPAHLQQGDIRYFLEKKSVEDFDRIVNKVRDIMIEYNSYTYSRY